MPVDKTLDLDLDAIAAESRRAAAAIKPGSGPWDVIVVGSGAAGGMAAFQLATAGIKVLVLEAGRLMDHRKEYRTMEWPYASPRRSRLPPEYRAITAAEYNFFDRPYGNHPELAKYKKVASYAGNAFTRNWVVNEKQHPTTGTPYSWVRARVLGGKTNFWGRVALRYGPLEFKAASRDGFDVDWPIGYEDVAPYYDKVDLLLGVLRHQGRPGPDPGRHLPAPHQAQLRRGALQADGRQDGPPLHAGPLRGHHRRRPEQQVPRALPGTRAVRARVRHQRRLPFAERPHPPRARHREPHPAAVFGRLRGDPRPRHRPSRGSAGHRRQYPPGDGFQGTGGGAGRGYPGQHAHPAQLQVGPASGRAGQLLGPARLLPERAPHGPARQRVHPDAHGHRAHPGRRAPHRALPGAFPEHHRQASGLHPRLPLPGRRRGAGVPGLRPRHPRLRPGVQVVRPQALSRADRHRRIRRGAPAEGEPGLAGR